MQDLQDLRAYADAVDDDVQDLQWRIEVIEKWKEQVLNETQKPFPLDPIPPRPSDEKIGCDSVECPGRDELSAYQSFECDGKEEINKALYALVPGGMTMAEFDQLTCDVFYKIRAAWDKQMSSSKR